MLTAVELQMGFAENLKRLRDAKGWTQAVAASHAGVPFRSYQNWEAGIREPRLDALKRLAVALGTTVDVLLEGVGGDGGSAEEPEPPARPMGKRK